MSEDKKNSRHSQAEEDDDSNDQIIAAIGDWGPWQRNHITILSTMTLFSSVPSLIIKYMSASTDYVCSPPDNLTSFLNGDELRRPGADIEHWRNLSHPIISKGGKDSYDSCRLWNSTDFTQPDDNSTIPCEHWTYNRTEWWSTTIDQWDLVCDRAYYISPAQSAYFAGMMVGIFVAGFLSDMFGRKATLIPLNVTMCVIGTILPFLPGILSFMIMRFWHGFFKIGVFTLVFVWSMEVVGNRWKTFVGIGLEFPWVASWIFLAVMTWILPDWKKMTLITSVPGLIYVFLYWYIPESPKWLLATGREKEAEKVCREIAKGNGRPLPESWNLAKVVKDKPSSHNGNIIDIFRKKNMTIKTLILYFNWFTNSFIYYGLTLNTGGLGGSVKLNFLLNGILEIPAYLISLYFIHKGGRKLPYSLMMAFGGACLFCTIIIPQDVFPNNWPVITLAMLGKLAITGTFGIIYVYSAEIYPTPVRAVGIGSSSVFARLGGIVAPYIGQLDKVVHPTFPIAIFGLTGIAAAFLALFLPETKTRKLPDTMEEGENVPVGIRDGLCDASNKA